MKNNKQKDQNCIFCKIIKKEISSSIIYENKDFIAILDINPTNKGHTLIVIKDHYRNLKDFPDNKGNELIKFAKKVSNALIKATNADGFNFSMNNEAPAGQAIFHAHFHLIPRFKDDGLRHWPHKQYQNNEAKELASKIKKLIS